MLQVTIINNKSTGFCQALFAITLKRMVKLSPNDRPERNPGV
jgi:hypothetical protein